MYSTVAWAKASPEADFTKIEIQRNAAGVDDVTFDLKYCGICHTDVHYALNDMGGYRTEYMRPCWEFLARHDQLPLCPGP